MLEDGIGGSMMEKYQFVKKSERELFIVTIVADSNDGDYITTINSYSRDVFDEYVVDGLIDLKEKADGQHKLESYKNEFDLDIPYNGYDGYCHTLEELVVEYIDENSVLLDVELQFSRGV
jgi:hypothetical protein